MTTKERLIQEIDEMTEKQKAEVLRYASLVKRGVKIERFYKGVPVVKEAELSKLDLEGYFNDDWNKEEEK